MEDKNNIKGIRRSKDHLNTKRKKGKNFLLGIGINDYDQFPKLFNCVKDIKDFENELLNNYDFEDDNTFILINQAATRREILKKLDFLYQKISEEDTLTFIYSGHGENLSQRNIGFLVPSDAKDEYDFIDLSSIKNRLDTFKAKHIFLIFDSCFSGLILTQRITHNKNLPEDFPSRFALTSGRNGPVSDGLKGDNSPFMKIVLFFLQENRDRIGVIDLSQKVLDSFTNQIGYQLPDFGIINHNPKYRGQFYLYPKNYVENITIQKKKITELKTAVSIIEKQNNELANSFDEINKQTKRVKLFSIVAVVLLIASILGLININRQRNKAIQQAKINKSLALASKSLLEKEIDPTSALQLAVEGYKNYNTEENAYALNEITSDQRLVFYTNKIKENDNIHALAYSNHKDIIAAGTEKGYLKLWDRKGELLFEFDSLHQSTILALQFSPDGSFILSGDRDGQFILWDVKGNVIFKEKYHENWISSLSFSKDGQKFIVGSADGRVSLWSTNGSFMNEFSIGNTSIAYLKSNNINSATNSLGQTVFAVSDYLEGMKEIQRYLYGINAVVFSPDDDFILAGGVGGKVYMWAQNGTLKKEFVGYKKEIIAIDISSDGKFILAGGYDKTGILWNEDGGVHSKLIGHSRAINAAKFIKGDRYILTAGSDNLCMLWNKKGELIKQFVGHKEPVFSIATTDSDQYIFTSGLDSLIIEWDLLYRTSFKKKFPHNDLTRAVDFSPDSKSFVTGASDGTISIWSINGTKTDSFQIDEPGSRSNILPVAFSPDGRYIATIDNQSNGVLYNKHGNLLEQFIGHKDEITSVSFSPNGLYLLTTSIDSTAIIWNLEGDTIRTLKGHQSWLWSGKFAPNSSNLITCGGDNMAIIWNLEGDTIRTLKKHSDYVESVDFSPDGTEILTGSCDGTAILWNRNGEICRSFNADDSGCVFVVKFISDDLILTAGRSGKAIIWNKDGFPIQTFDDHGSYSIWASAISPDGNYIVTAGDDRKAFLRRNIKKLLD